MSLHFLQGMCGNFLIFSVSAVAFEFPGMETHYSILAGRIPRTEEPGRLWSMWSQRVVSKTEATEHARTVFCLALNREKRQK